LLEVYFSNSPNSIRSKLNISSIASRMKDWYSRIHENRIRENNTQKNGFAKRSKILTRYR